MATASLLALLDDIASVLDDVAILTKVATKKTAGVLGDDLAVNAEQVSGVRARREIPVVWAVFKGSLLNKLILVPAALVLSVIAPWAITPVLIMGGLFLCYEGFEKLLHSVHPDAEDKAHQQALTDALKNPDVDLAQLEKDKIRGAIRTDFILSAEIIAIALGVVADADLPMRITVLSVLAIAVTVGVYGLVAAIVKMDDAGLYLSSEKAPGIFAASKRVIGRGLLAFAPLLMKSLSFIGMVAMFMVGGGILVHGIPWLHHGVELLLHSLEQSAALLLPLVPQLANLLIGTLTGMVVFALITLVQRLRGKAQAA